MLISYAFLLAFLHCREIDINVSFEYYEIAHGLNTIVTDYRYFFLFLVINM